MTTTEQQTQEQQAIPRMQWIRPQCHFCTRGMYTTRHQIIENDRTGQTYVKTTYVCPHCDYWQTIKVPRKLALTVIDEEFLPHPQVTEPVQA